MGRIVVGFWLVGLCGLAQAEQEDTLPERLLPQALAIARGLPDGTGYGNWAKPLAVLRIGATMRLRGMTAEAAAAMEECTTMTLRLTEPATRDELLIELCREFVLLGQTARARRLPKEIGFRNYATVARYVTARTAIEADRPAEGESILRETLTAGRPPQGKAAPVDALWTRACVRLAVRIHKIELARQLADSIQDPLWKSASLADLAEALAQAGKTDDALRVAAEIPDASVAVLAYSRLAGVFSRKEAAGPRGRALDRLKARAAKIAEQAARDFALRVAVRRLTAAGDADAGTHVAAQIASPAARVLAGCTLLNPAGLGRLLDELPRCPEPDRPLLAEALVVACGAKGMGTAALEASARVPPGWQRLRALSEAARRSADARAKPEAAKLLAAAAETVREIGDPGWRCCARVRLALCEHRLGNAASVDANLEAARSEALRLTQPELSGAVLPQVVEAALAVGRREFAADTVLRALKGEPDAALRNRLVPMLAAAGRHEAALAECSRKPLGDASARRLMVYRLALTGERGRAVAFAARLSPNERGEALADVARAQLTLAAAGVGGAKVVGVSLHGSWGSWLPRLERMGVDWELMPFSAPYEDGPEGLSAKYSMLAYPGTGGHEAHVAVAGAEHLRQYLYSGGGFFGICAGQFLATGRKLVPCDTLYMRGRGPHQVQIRKNHPVALDLPPVVVIPRHNGGMLIPRPGCEVIGWYDTVDRYAALVASNCGLGRVVAFSPHPEGSSGLVPCDRVCISATLWTIGELP